jgi:methionyl-tRNA formyltransferase
VPEAILVVAPPTAARGGWQEALASAARAAGAPTLEPENVNNAEVVAAIAAHHADLLLSVYYTQLFSDELRAAVEGPALNFHPSLLPRHRGTAPVIWAIVEGDAVTGLSVHHIDSGIDTGRLVCQRSLPIHPLDTGFQLHMKLALLARGVAAEILRYYLRGEGIPNGHEQTGETTVHTSRDPRVNHLDWTTSRERVRNIVRALAPPLPGAFVEVGGRRLILAEVEPASAAGAPPRLPGMVETDAEGQALVWAADGALRISSVVADGQRVPGGELHSLGIVTGTIFA